jgi:TrmH family RNA methyltransferase
VLHEVRDPGNAGTIVRSADAAGTDGVVFTSSSVDVYNPKTVRASAGSIFHLPVVRGVSTPEAIESLRARGHRILAMDARGSEQLYVTALHGPIAFVFGNEAHGLAAVTSSRSRMRQCVPHGKAESLNLKRRHEVMPVRACAAGAKAHPSNR